MNSGKQIRVTQVRSPIGYDRKQRATLRGLGLRRINHSVTSTMATTPTMAARAAGSSGSPYSATL